MLVIGGIALRLASRVAAVREAAGFAAYANQKYAEALADASVDGVLCWDVFDYLDKASAVKLAGQLTRLLKPEGVSKVVSRPLVFFSRVMSPFIWLLNGMANQVLRLFGMRAASEISRVSTLMPACFVNACTIGRREYVARAGASSVLV